MDTPANSGRRGGCRSWSETFGGVRGESDKARGTVPSLLVWWWLAIRLAPDKRARFMRRSERYLFALSIPQVQAECVSQQHGLPGCQYRKNCQVSASGTGPYRSPVPVDQVNMHPARCFECSGAGAFLIASLPPGAWRSGTSNL